MPFLLTLNMRVYLTIVFIATKLGTMLMSADLLTSQMVTLMQISQGKLTRRLGRNMLQLEMEGKKHGSNDDNPIVINGNNERNNIDPLVNKGKSPIRDLQTDKAGTSKEVDNLIPEQSNRFDSLVLVDKEHNDDNRDTMRNADIQLEAKINQVMQDNQLNANDKYGRNDDEDHSSSCSEFVEASNMENFEVQVDMNEVKSDTPVPANLQQLERKNKAFLDQSWANIADNDEAEHRLLKDLEK